MAYVLLLSPVDGVNKSIKRDGVVQVHMNVVVLLNVRRGLPADFGRYEQQVAAVVARHGGSVERTVPLRGPSSIDTYNEVRIVHFPSDDAFRAFSRDPQLRELDALRDKVVTHMDIFVGEA